jgi:hypothetical protein
MHEVWDNANPKKVGKNYVFVSKLDLNYARSSETHPRIKCDRTPLDYKWLDECERGLTVDVSIMETHTRRGDLFSRASEFVHGSPLHQLLFIVSVSECVKSPSTRKYSIFLNDLELFLFI